MLRPRDRNTVATMRHGCEYLHAAHCQQQIELAPGMQVSDVGLGSYVVEPNATRESRGSDRKIVTHPRTAEVSDEHETRFESAP